MGGKTLLLENIRSERAFSADESLWDDEISRLKKLIEEHLTALEEFDEGKKNIDKTELPKLSIGIFGSPGSGKTSLVETFVRQINEKTLKIESENNQIYALPVIKPNPLARDEHFIYKFLAVALEQDRKNNQPTNSIYRDSSILSPLQQTFQEVCEYLQVINETGCRQEDDPIGISLDRLERQESGVKLAEKMRNFIDQLAPSLTGNRNALIFMPVDDADLSMDTLIPAISTCWRYLQHERLVPIFTFTGRLAEELLRVHFEEKLTVKGNFNATEKLKEATTSLMMTESMALQYLGKLFPVRNRIRMGHASARVVEAKYKSRDAVGDPKEYEVYNLLETVSILLFGRARTPIVPEIRPPLRMVMLRRQLQIVDAMQASGIERFMKGYYPEKKEDNTDHEKEKIKETVIPEKTWGQMFDLATWTLLNTHRDILRELNLNLDDLYGWTPRGLRKVILDRILGMPAPERRKILKHWYYRTEERRSHILSLLAANIFRPRMFGEEPTGDEPHTISAWKLHQRLKSSNLKNDIEKHKRNMLDNKDSFPVSVGALWFINLCIGFYLPQIIATNGDMITIQTKARNTSDTIQGMGWDKSSGPIHAMREALAQNKVFSTGMLFLNPEKYYEITKKEDHKPYSTLAFISTWCYHGYKNGRPWAAVSLWRGLGLIGRLVKYGLEHSTADSFNKNDIRIILKEHFKSATVLGTLPKESKPVPAPTDNSFSNRSKINFSQNLEYVEDSLFKGKENKLFNFLVKSIITWLRKYTSPVALKRKRITPLIDEEKNENKWESSFINRLHGEGLVKIFWQDLEKCYYNNSTDGKDCILENWNLHTILCSWYSIVENYWKYSNSPKSPINMVGSLIREFPLYLPSFQDQVKSHEKKTTFNRVENELSELVVEEAVPYSIFYDPPPREKPDEKCSTS